MHTAIDQVISFMIFITSSSIIAVFIRTLVIVVAALNFCHTAKTCSTGPHNLRLLHLEPSVLRWPGTSLNVAMLAWIMHP